MSENEKDDDSSLTESQENVEQSGNARCGEICTIDATNIRRIK